MRIDSEFEVNGEPGAFRLYRNGSPVIDEHGHPKVFTSLDDAIFTAKAWDLVRAPTLRELREMSDEEIIFRADC